MPWMEKTLMSEKEAFITQALKKEEPFSRLCNRFNISRQSGYRILKCYEREGVKCIIPKSKRPLTSPHKTSIEVEQAILSAREEEPAWGAKKIIQYLINKGQKDVPSKSTVNDILKRNGYISKEESKKRQKFIRFEREKPNELWQMDFKGRFPLLNKTPCYPLTIIDDHSRFSLAIRACDNERYETVKDRLFRVFCEYGKPKQINVDNGNPWGNSNLSPYTKLTVWLMKIDILVTHSSPGHPQTNGKCERFHRTLKSELLQRQSFRTLTHAQKLFDNWRERYNQVRPHEAIDMNVPASRYIPSSNKMESIVKSPEYDIGAVVRKVRGNGLISFKGNTYYLGSPFEGEFVRVDYNETTRSLDIYFGPFKVYSYDR